MRTKILRKKWKRWIQYSDRNFEHDYVVIKYYSKHLVINEPDFLELFFCLMVAVCVALVVAYG